MQHTFIRLFLLLFVIVNGSFSYSYAQQLTLKLHLEDSASHTTLIQAFITDSTSKQHAFTDLNGNAVLTIPIQPLFHIEVKAVTFSPKILRLHIVHDTSLNIYLTSLSQNMEEVVVESFRTQSRIEDNPMKIEVVGYEDMQEEGGVQPGNISSMLGDFAGTQVQQTSAVSGNADLRMQGLDGRYTQILQNGMPLFGGWAGSFGLLQLPPADLKQIELIKGASSALYGNGAIAGILNLVSKTPILNNPEHTILINQTSLSETDFNTFNSWRNKRWGYTLFAGGTYQKDRDVDGDGFTDVPLTYDIFFHPVWFRYFNSRQTLSIGYDFTYDKRTGGDMDAVNNNNAANGYLVTNASQRHSVYMSYKDQHRKYTFTTKVAGSLYLRDVTVNDTLKHAETGTYYAEAAWSVPGVRSSWVLGVALNGTVPIDTAKNISAGPVYQIAGVFAQNDWNITRRFTMEAGVRTDYVLNHTIYPLPHLALLYKPAKSLLLRLSGGLGYKLPTSGDYLDDERYLTRYTYLPTSNLKAEQSQSANADIKYSFKSDEWIFTFNEDVFYTHITSPVDINYNNINYTYTLSNLGYEPIRSAGQEFWMSAKAEDDIELYAGYTYTDGRRMHAPSDSAHLPLIAPNKAAAVIAYSFFDEKLKLGFESAFFGSQFRDNDTRTPSYFTFAASVIVKLKHITVVLNCENLTNYRQQNHETVVVTTPTSSIPDASMSNPYFKPLWAPVEGRVVNLSFQYRF